MQSLIDGVRHFQREVFPAKADLFTWLSTAQHPTALFIGCSDSRVPPELITSAEPGELFVIRTAGNLVPAYAPGAGDGVTASIEYAVAELGVTDIVVCGHSACGAMTALAQGHDLSAVPAVAGWLRNAESSRARAESTAPNGVQVADLVRWNVAAQLTNVATHPAVAKALAARTLTLHGWVFDIATGAVEDIDTGTGEFTSKGL
ncbi:carbonic anhydrase [Nocardia sp. NPDC088792]|uniref:carbonic anhydrase n=1 Tax=Nocardia sp. NPDC088792 TaxID=3364332 RepID=UPI0038155787